MATENHLKKAVGGAAWVFFLGGVSYLVSYLFRVILARTLPLEQFGLFFAMLSLIMFATIFRDLGLGTAAVKYIAEGAAEKNNSKIKTTLLSSAALQLLHSILTFFIFLPFLGFLAFEYFRAEEALIAFPILLGLYLLSSVLLINLKSLLRGLQDMRNFSMADLIKNSSAVLIFIALWSVGLRLYAAIWSYIIGALVAFAVLAIINLKYLKIFKSKVKDFSQTTKKLYKFGIPVTFVGFGDMVLSYLDVLILTYFASLSAVGVYSAILPTAMAFLFFGRSVAAVIIPIVSELWTKEETKKVATGMQLVYTYLPLLILPLLFTVLVFARPLISGIFGKAFLDGVLAFQILLLGVAFYAVSQINHEVISGIGRPGITAKIIMTTAFANLVLNLLLIPRFRITGAAIATSVSYLLALLLSSWNLKKLAGTKIPLVRWTRIAFAGTLFTFTLYWGSNILKFPVLVEALLLLPLALVIYTIAILIFGVTSKKEVKRLLKQILIPENGPQ